MAPYPTWTLEESLAGTGLQRFVGNGRERSAPNEPAEAYESGAPALHTPRRWGLSAEAVAHLGDRLYQFWLRYRSGFTTRTRDTSAHAYDYLRAQLTMDTERNFANMDRTLHGGDGQALQHFMSNSPWSGQGVFSQIQAEIKAMPALAHGSTLILDESADEKAGTHNVGASRQYNGRLGKVDVCRVDTCLTYANGGLWAMVDGELFLPEEWFGAAFAQRRQELGIPAERRFETKLQLGLKMVKRVKAHGLPFDLLACDALYGRDSQFRTDVDAEGVQYAAQVPADTHVYLNEPRMGMPPKRSQRGRPRTRRQVLGGQAPERQNELIVRQCATSTGGVHVDRAVLQVDALYSRLGEAGGSQERPHRERAVPEVESSRAHLEEQRRDEEEVVPAHQDDLDIRPPLAELFQVAGGVHATEATAEDHDASLLRLGFSAGRCTLGIGCHGSEAPPAQRK